MYYKTNVIKRKELLIQLLKEIEVGEDQIIQALYDDFKKPLFESVLTEISFVKSELQFIIKNMSKWSSATMVWPSLLNFPSLDYIYAEPYGKILIIAPWNYPFQLAILPMISAFAAGNQVVLKPSELTPNTSQIISKIVTTVFEKSQIEVIEGGIEVSNELLSKRWDYIFFTGSVAVGKIVAKAAAQHLTPVTLELGGKSPCIVDETATIQLAAKRIAWGKFLNAGQTCVAPDYILVHESVKKQFVDELIKAITLFYGKNPEKSPDLARIVNHKNWSRLIKLMEGNTIITGGISDEKQLYIAPTLLDEPLLESDIMKEEIFGPLLPILSYSSVENLNNIISKFEKPLAFYLFSNSKSFAQYCIKNYPFGGGCINDVAVHLANKRLPFGGIGHSGIGAYHGKNSFDTFSHQKSIVKKANYLDIPLRYPPYKNKINWIRKFLNWM